MEKSFVIHKAIRIEYEWIQYNEQSIVIRSIKDDMYQMQSIIKALQPKTRNDPSRWLALDSKKELIEVFEENIEKLLTRNIASLKNMVEYRDNLAIELRGWYCHRLLINLFAAGVSPKYAFQIALLLDDLAIQERNEMKNKLKEKDQKIEEQKPRMVPKNRNEDYKYMIWKEEMSEDDEMVMLHLVRTSNDTFKDVAKYRNDPDKFWLFVDKLPIAMSTNKDVMTIIKRELVETEYDIKSCNIITFKAHLPLLHEKINEVL